MAVRGTEDVRQSMNVVIAKTDGSNGVKYTIEAASHFEMVMVKWTRLSQGFRLGQI